MGSIKNSESPTDTVRTVDASQCADNELAVLLNEACETEPEVDDFISLVHTIVGHLRDSRFQKLLVSRKLVPKTLELVVRSFSQNPFLGTSLANSYPASIACGAQDENQLLGTRSALIASLSDVSATSTFTRKYPIDSTTIKTLCVWLAVSDPSIKLCACLMLGNQARSDAMCKDMVHQIGLHELLVEILATSDDLQLLHATLGFLKNLAMRVENKGTIANSNILEPLSKIWSQTSKYRLHYDVVRVVRQLVNGSLSNIQRLSIAQLSGEEDDVDERSYLAQLLELFDKSSDDVSVRVEISRIVAAIWRCVRSPASTQYFSDIVEATLPYLDSMAAGLAKALVAMVTQSRWPVVSSEGWFALALMARSKQGSDAIVDLLSEIELCKAVVEVIGAQGANKAEIVSLDPGNTDSVTRADSTELRPEEKLDMQKKDRDNALVLVNEMVKNSVSTRAIPDHIHCSHFPIPDYHLSVSSHLQTKSLVRPLVYLYIWPASVPRIFLPLASESTYHYLIFAS